jgi:hypothetical protein
VHTLNASGNAFEQIIGTARNSPGLLRERKCGNRLFERLQRGLGNTKEITS